MKHPQKPKKDNEKPKTTTRDDPKKHGFFVFGINKKMRQHNCGGNFWELLEGFLEGNFVRRSSSFVDVYFLQKVFSGPPDVLKEQIPFSRLAEG